MYLSTIKDHRIPLGVVRTWIEAIPVEGVVVLGVGVCEPRPVSLLFSPSSCSVRRGAR